MTDTTVEKSDQSSDFLYDFLYVDNPRLSSFLSHFDDDGIMTGVKKSQSEDLSTGAEFKGNAQVASGTRKKQTANKKAIEMNFDRSLILPREAMDQLNEASFIQYDLDKSQLGQIVMLSGSLSLIDFRVMQELWDVAIKLGIADNIKDLPHAKKIKEETRLKKEWGDTKDLIKSMPHALTANLDSTDFSAFSMLDPDHLRIQAESITLSHAGSFPGRWFVLGLLDGHPDNVHLNSLPSFQSSGSNPILDIMNHVSLVARAALGRPGHAYAITPIVIFRKVEPV